MSWEPFVQERSLAIEAFKKAIVETRGYIFPAFKRSRWRQKSLWQKIKTMPRGFKSNYHDIVQKNLAIVYLGYVAYLNFIAVFHTDLSGFKVTEAEKMASEGLRDLSEYHFFAIDYVDPKILDRLFEKMGCSAGWAAVKVAAKPIAAHAIGMGVEGLDLKGTLLGSKAVPFLEAVEASKEAYDQHGDIRRFRMGNVKVDLPGAQTGGLQSWAPSNEPIGGGGRTHGGLRLGLRERYGKRSTFILDWQYLCVRQTTLVNIDASDQEIYCSKRSKVGVGPIDGAAIEKIVHHCHHVKSKLYGVFNQSRTYWREHEKRDLTYYDHTKENEFETLQQSKFTPWKVYMGDSPRRAIIQEIPRFPYGVGPIADEDI